MRFYLGLHNPRWLGVPEVADVPVFVSRTQMPTKRFPRATGRWAGDSGGFTEITQHGNWTVTPHDYAAMVRRWTTEVGGLDFACIQDWVCADIALEKSRLTVEEHIVRTVTSLRVLRDIAPDLPWAPVLQGRTYDDYMRCCELYENDGVSLADEPTVAIGSIAARQTDLGVRQTIRQLHRDGVRLHGLGVKSAGIDSYFETLSSADSMAWSSEARKMYAAGIPSCDPERRKTCANCLHYALEWREKRIIPLLNRLSLFEAEAA